MNLRNTVRYVMSNAAFYRVVACVLVLCCSGGAIQAQTGLPAEEARKIERLLIGAERKSVDERIKALAAAAEAMRPYAEENVDLRSGTSILEFEREYLEISGTRFNDLLKTAVGTSDPEAGRLAAQRIRMSLLPLAANMALLVAQDGITAEEAEKFLKLAKILSKAVDALKDNRELAERGSFAGASSDLTQTLTRLNGILDLYTGITDSSAKEIMSGMQGTLGTIKLPGATNPFKLIELPAGQVGVLVQDTKENFEAATGAVVGVGDYIDDPSHENARRLAVAVDTMKQIGGRKDLGAKMLDAIAEKVPPLKPLTAWFGGISKYCELRNVGKYSSNSSSSLPMRYKVRSKLSCNVVDVFGHKLERFVDALQIKEPLPVAVPFAASVTLNECGGEVWPGTYLVNFAHPFYPYLPCGYLDFEPATEYQLTVKGNLFGRLKLVQTEGSEMFLGMLDVISESGDEITSISVLGPGADIEPGKYTLQLRANSGYGDLLPANIEDGGYAVTVRPGAVTKFVLPKLE